MDTVMASMTTFLKVPKPKHKPSPRPPPSSQRPVLQFLQVVLALVCSASYIPVPDNAQFSRHVAQWGGANLSSSPLLSAHLITPNITALEDDKQLIAQDPCGFVVYQLPAAQIQADKALPYTLLTLAGDVQPNPGPAKKGKKRSHRQRRPSTPDCPTCKQPVTWDPDVPALQCDGCDKWMHAFCIPGMTTEKYNALAADVKGEWHCPTCVEAFKVPPMRLTRQNGTWKVSAEDPRSGDDPKPSEPKPTKAKQKPFRDRKRMPNDVKTVVLNANSLKGKVNPLKAMIESVLPHIIIMTETKLSKRFKTSELFDTSQYSVFRKDRNARGGGVLVAISNELDGYDIDLKLETESVYVLLHGKNQSPTLVGAIYRPPQVRVSGRSFEGTQESDRSQ